MHTGTWLLAVGLTLTALAAPFGALGLDALEIAEPANALYIYRVGHVSASCHVDTNPASAGCVVEIG